MGFFISGFQRIIRKQKQRLRKGYSPVFLLTVFRSALETITGVVISAEDNEPLIGASVVEEGATNKTTTGIAGKYSITVSDAAKKFVFTFAGL